MKRPSTIAHKETSQHLPGAKALSYPKLRNSKSIAMCLLIALLFASEFHSTQVEASKSEPRIFNIFSYTPGPWTDGLAMGMTTGFKNRGLKPIQQNFYLDSDHYFKMNDYERQTIIHQAIETIKSFGPDYIVISDDESASQFLPSLYPLKKPIIFTGINGPENSLAGATEHRDLMTGVFERYPMGHTIRLLNDLSPAKIEKIKLITTQTKKPLAIIDSFQEYFAKSNRNYHIDSVLVSSNWTDWQRALEECNATHTAPWILVPFDVVDAHGAAVSLKTMGEWFLSHIRVPSLSIIDIIVEMGVMASVSVSPNILGEEAAKMIAQHQLDHIPIANIAFQFPTRNEIIINKQATDRIGVKIPVELLEYAKITGIGTRVRAK